MALLKTKTLSVTVSLFLVTVSLRAQQNDSLRHYQPPDHYLAILVGGSAGSYVNGEIGLAGITDKRAGFHPATLAWSLSDEIRVADKLLMGPKVGVWISGGLAMGLNMIYYTDFNGGALVFRPEIGGGLSNIKLVYGYNARLTNTAFGGINTNLVEFLYGFRLRKKTH